jgi:hypothetical protein
MPQPPLAGRVKGDQTPQPKTLIIDDHQHQQRFLVSIDPKTVDRPSFEEIELDNSDRSKP